MTTPKERVLSYLRAEFEGRNDDGHADVAAEDIADALTQERQEAITATAHVARIFVGPGEWAAFEEAIAALNVPVVAKPAKPDGVQWYTAVTCPVATCVITATHWHRDLEFSR